MLSRLNTSLNKRSQKGAIRGINREISKRPTVRVIGKPITNTESWGAIRFSKPSARLTVSSRVITGSASIRPLRKIIPAARVRAIKALLFTGSPPIGRLWNVSTSIEISHR
ncbi:hypothetical protein D3C76_1587070 [compost metagenome]